MALATIIGVVLLGLFLAYGAWRSKTRNRALDGVRDEAIRDQYRENGSASGVPPKP